MKKTIYAVYLAVAVLSLALLAGCGGGNSGTTAVPSSHRGKLTLAFTWPVKGKKAAVIPARVVKFWAQKGKGKREIPASTNCMTVTITQQDGSNNAIAGGDVQTIYVLRTPTDQTVNGETGEADFTPLIDAYYTVTATAVYFSGDHANDVPLAIGSAIAGPIQANQNNSADVTLTGIPIEVSGTVSSPISLSSDPPTYFKLHAIDIFGDSLTQISAQYYAWACSNPSITFTEFLDTSGNPVISNAGDSWDGSTLWYATYSGAPLQASDTLPVDIHVDLSVPYQNRVSYDFPTGVDSVIFTK